MPLVTRYAHLKKRDGGNGKYVPFQVARVLGLATELAHKKFKS